MWAPLFFTASLIFAPQVAHESQPVVVSTPNMWNDSGATKVWHGKPKWIRDLGYCIRRHESINAGHYKARYPNRRVSSAAGAYQMIQSTWTGNARFTPLAKPWAYMPASAAPPYAQDAVFIHSIERGGIRAWHGTYCSGT